MEVNTIEIHQKILRRRLLLKIGCTGMFLGLAIGLSIPFMLTAILHLLGFGTKGIIPGSIAAEWQASLHNLTKGTFFACKYFLVSFCHTVRNLHFMSKHSTLISRENCRLSWVKNTWKCCGFWLFSSWQLWFHEKNYQKILCENSWKCCGFGLFSCWQLWFHEKDCQKKKLGWKTGENVGGLHFLVVDNFDLPRKIVKFCQNCRFGQKFDFSNSVNKKQWYFCYYYKILMVIFLSFIFE